MNISFKRLGVVLAAGSLLFTSCKEEEPDTIVEQVFQDLSVQTPDTYAFDSRFSEGVSSVSYSGQTVRHLLIQDINSLISAAKTTTNTNLKADILALYDYADNNQQSLTTAGSFDLVESTYDNISTGKNLTGKISDETVIGYGVTADELFRGWVDSLDVNINTKSLTGSDILYTSDSLDLGQMINKLLLGSVVYSQGTAKYLTNVPTEDNVSPKKEGSSYTVAEHVWDEAFGYFGAARNYAAYTTLDLKSKDAFYKDANGDGKIDFQSEYNFGLSKNAGKRDYISETTGINPKFQEKCFAAFLAGRTAVANQRSSAEIEIFAREAAQNWEKVIAATAIHYINETVIDLQNRIDGVTYDKGDLYKHWSEMKAFTIALQYGGPTYQLVADSDLSEFASTMGTGIGDVVKAGNSAMGDYINDIEGVANQMRLIYDFDKANVDVWRQKK